jgi:hypothetical protein
MPPDNSWILEWSFQSGNDIEQCRFTAAAGADETDKLSFWNAERDIIKGVDRQRSGPKPFRDMFEDQLGGHGIGRIDFSRSHLSSAVR